MAMVVCYLVLVDKFLIGPNHMLIPHTSMTLPGPTKPPIIARRIYIWTFSAAQ